MWSVTARAMRPAASVARRHRRLAAPRAWAAQCFSDEAPAQEREKGAFEDADMPLPAPVDENGVPEFWDPKVSIGMHGRVLSSPGFVLSVKHPV